MPDENLEEKVKDSGSCNSLAYDTGVEFGGIASGVGLGTLAYHYLPHVVGNMIGYAASATAIAAGVTGLGVLTGYAIGKAILGGLRSKPKKEEPEKAEAKGPPKLPMPPR